MLYEIINPSDPYTMEAESLAAAMAAVAILGEGRYGLDPIGHDGSRVPVIIFGDWAEHLYSQAGISPPTSGGLFAWLENPANNESAAKALDSVRFGRAADRDVPREVGERRRSSMNNIGKFAWEYAEAMRGKRAFAPIDAKSGNG